MIAVSYQTPVWNGDFGHPGRGGKTHGRSLTGHIFKIKMIAVSFGRDSSAPAMTSGRKCVGNAFQSEMIAQS
jgi:hypothetical protein